MEETMIRKNRVRVPVFLAAALGAVAMLALPAVAPAKHHGRSDKRHGHHGHHRSSAPAGTIQSFDPESGRLVIALSGEETIGGLVTGQTKIKCEDEHAPDVTASRTHLRHGEEEPGDDRDEGGQEPGDDHGEGGEEAGDDRGGDSSQPGTAPSGPSGHDDNGTGANCTTSDLIAGAVVQRAELELEGGSASFDEVELAG
jgi:hypothetical protein